MTARWVFAPAHYDDVLRFERWLRRRAYRMQMRALLEEDDLGY